MKAVLMSIQPKWVEKIAIGEKTIEVRKTKPNLKTPFKVFIYCTKGKDLLREVDNWHTGTKTHTTNYRIINLDYCTNKIANGKVIGEFVCSEIEPFTEYECLYDGHYVEEKTRVSQKELLDYKGKNDFLYGWHISDLKIYDKPKELSEFKRWNRTEDNVPCSHTKWLYPDCKYCKACNLTKPPQSWCYVEAQE